MRSCVTPSFSLHDLENFVAQRKHEFGRYEQNNEKCVRLWVLIGGVGGGGNEFTGCGRKGYEAYARSCELQQL